MRTLRRPFALRLALSLTLAAALTGAACGDDGGTSAGADTVAPTDTLGGDDAVADALVDDTALVDDAAAPDDTAGATDTATADTAPAPLSDFTSPGSYNVGFRETSVTYTPAEETTPRTLRVVAWYPTHDTTGTESLYAGLLSAPQAFFEAAPATDLGPRPVVIFSHGNGGFAEQSYFFTEFLASHGYLVVALDHTGNTFSDISNDPPVQIFHWRPLDVSAVLDHLEALPATDPLAPFVSDRIAVSGHSFGGYTTLLVGGAGWAVDLVLAYCLSNELPAGGCDAIADYEDLYRAGFLDPRVDALIPMAPGGVIVMTGGIDAIGLPTLLFTGQRDDTTPNATDGDPAWSGLSWNPENLRVDFANAGHFTFSNACDLPLGVGDGDGCGDTFLPPADAYRAIDAYALAFLRLHLEGDASGAHLLDGTTEVESDAVLSFGQ